MTFSKNQKLGLIFGGIGIALIAGFQNCGAGFEVLKVGSSAGTVAPLESAPAKLSFEDGPHTLVGDMVVQDVVYDRLQKAPSGAVRAAGHLPAGLVAWPGGRIPIAIPRFVFDPTPKDGVISIVPSRRPTEIEYMRFAATVAEVCRIWSEVANITCVIDSNTEINQMPENTLTAMMLDDTDVDLCGSNPTVSCAKIGGPGMTSKKGYTTTRPWMAIRTASILNVGLVLHEMGHVLGLLHEHQRADASKYVMLSPAMPENERSGYLMLQDYVGVIPNSKFDFASVMMYAANGELNAKFLEGSAPLGIRSEYFHNGAQREMSQYGQISKRPSILDVETVRMIYGPPTAAGRASCTLGSETIPHGSHIAVYGPEVTATATGYTNCATSSRRCDNGVLSGSGDKMSCNMHCEAGGVQVKYAASREFYKSPTVGPGLTCEKQTRTCTQASGLTTPAGQQPYTFASCSVLNPSIVMCSPQTESMQSTPNSAGQRTTCSGTLPQSNGRIDVLVSGTATNGGSIVGECGPSGWVKISGTCPQPADPPPVNAPVYCAPESRVFESIANSAGMKTTCIATLPQSLAGSMIVPTSISNAGTFSAQCGNDGRLSAVQMSCPAPAVPTAPTTPVTPAELSCQPTKQYLQSYSMSGVIKPMSTDVGQRGFYFVGGYDPNGKAWYSFDGRVWSKHAGVADSSFFAIGGVDVLNAQGINGQIFTNENLTPFPNGQIYVGYGIGANKVAAWDNMIGAVRYKLCDVLPSAPDECVNSVGNKIPGCIYQ